MYRALLFPFQFVKFTGMAIQVQTVVDRGAAALDAENNDYYKFDQDYKPNINSAIEWLVLVFNEIFGKKKVVPEQLRDLVKVRVFQANQYSRVSFNPADVGHSLWTIIGVYPEPQLHPNNSIAPLADPNQSKFMPGKSFVRSDYSAARKTSEQANINHKNPFLEGSEVFSSTSGLRQFSYRDFADYSSSTYSNPSAPEIEIRPSIGGKYVAIEYLKYPTPVTLITDVLEFPESMTQVITEKMLSFMSTKQGDQTTLWNISEGDIKRITGLLS
jgi:hypothetical protein